MAEPTKYPQNSLVTSTATEVGITLEGDFYEGPITAMMTLVSGSLQYTVVPRSDTFIPAIDQNGFTHNTWSTADARMPCTIDPVNSEIRIKGVGTFSLNW